MRHLFAASVVLSCLLALASPASAQLPPGGTFGPDGNYYVPGGVAAPINTQDETAYYRGVYAVAPGFGPYLRLGGESGWNPNIGSTYNAYPAGDYYTDYGLLSPFSGYDGLTPGGVVSIRYGLYGAVPYRYPYPGYVVWPWR